MDKPIYSPGEPHRRLVYAWEGEVEELRKVVAEYREHAAVYMAQIERLRAALKEAKEWFDDQGQHRAADKIRRVLEQKADTNG